MKHLLRAGVLLAIFAIVFVLLILVPAPAFLEPYGFFRGGNDEDTELWANKPMQYAISSVCGDCHQDRYDIWEKAGHSSVNCESCHGPAMAHVEEASANPAVETSANLVVDPSRELCGLCHGMLLSRPSGFPQVDLETMGGGAECITCHDPHDPRAGMPPQVPHGLDGRTDECQLCHAPHEPFEAIPPQIPHTLEGRTECLVCHRSQEPGGAIPFIPHRSLEGLADCLLCHQAGGLKPFPEDHAGRDNYTCLSCHKVELSSQPPPHVPHPVVEGFDCLLCHEAGGLKPFPEDHAGRDSYNCLNCHEVELPSQPPPQAPHRVGEDLDCLLCHEAGGLKPFPEDHAGWDSDICLNCHRIELP